ncbi:MAG: hypothetical protein RKO66_20345 [Candidatus Contendobacter sp.]|nr:hypothetical protein [Candidatus Contendobacter sp.]MDS4058165.1 hypothetical protein [Candidatus Contendobacter sp.]
MTYPCILKQGLIGTAVVLLLSACANDPSACDPRKGGFIAGLSAMGSGCYEKRIEEKQDKLSSAQSLTERLQGEQKSLRHQKGSTARQKSQTQGQASRTTGSQSSARKKSQQGDSEEIKQLERELKKATEERDRMTRDVSESVVH